VPWFYHVSKIILKVLFSLLTRWQVRGRENVPRQGPLIVIVNHLHNVDPPLVGVSLGRIAIFMAKQQLFRTRLLNYFVRGLGAFPVRRGQPDRKALRQADQVLADGQALILFPEGTRSRSGHLESAFLGSALIAVRNGVPILPIGISGTEKLKGTAWPLRRPRITVNIGSPFHLPSVNNKLTTGEFNMTKEELSELTDYMMERIAELLPLEYRGNYGRAKN